MTEQNSFKEWAILEIMGRLKLAGLLSEQVIAGQGFIRIDVPEVGDRPGFTRLFGPSSVYGITPTTEEVCRMFTERSAPDPVQRWELPQLEAPQPRERERERRAYDGYDDSDELRGERLRF